MEIKVLASDMEIPVLANMEIQVLANDMKTQIQTIDMEIQVLASGFPCG
jgi:hypothetical protein